MKCKYCKTEMLIDKVEEKNDTEIFIYKCPNKNCTNYGFDKKKVEIKIKS